ncbi:hypothetical protein [Olleya sp. Bg11-27]|uniref:hypothetical protein n=1 Tax=Olleya sp. Bg11-27 TaxID=2058135 RepID=UPI000C315974|nr:hypothetical protein [Olleya sp. Bg11-27]AUC74726.1 hypothetical protein CW732_03150 [Olleya sp. Bg11-27]
MSQELPKKNNDNKSEEIDLLVLFNLIGNAFGKVYSFFESIVKTLYKLLISILLHFFRSAKWYAIGLVLSFVMGYVLDEYSDKQYGANMFINTNFNSTRQVYENIRNLNQLASIDKDSKEIAKQLKLTEEEASHIKGFFIEPDVDQNIQLKMYNEFRSGLDSVGASQSNFKDYVDGLKKYNFGSHKIGVLSTNKNIYKNLKTNFVDFIRENPYLDSLKQTNLANLRSRIKDITTQEEILDSLKNSYLAIRIKESEKSVSDGGGNGTNLYMGNAQSNELLVDESKITNLLYVLASEKTELENEFYLKQNVIDVVSNFPVSGYDISVWTDYKKYTFPIACFILIFIMLNGLQLSRFLKAQK